VFWKENTWAWRGEWKRCCFVGSFYRRKESGSQWQCT